MTLTSPDVLSVPIAFDNSYARLSERFFARVSPTPVSAPKLIRLNAALAGELGLDAAALQSPEGVEMLAGNRIGAGSEPIAMAYAGHQFGGFVPQLGDGRAILLGEVIAPDGRRRDIQLKGAGRTPFSRMGDGRAALGPVLREYIVSEAFAALGIPTTRALAAVLTGDYVYRENPLPGAILTRVAASHVRVGTFQYFAVRQDLDALRMLADYVIARHDPQAAHHANPCAALLDGVIGRQAELIARWMQAGFIHGVMNTDNMTISGETIDFGPCAFMDTYHPATVFSSIDRDGRYAYSNQPAIGQWNLVRLAETLLPLLAPEKDGAVAVAQDLIDSYPARVQSAIAQGFAAKIGITGVSPADAELVQSLLTSMALGKADFTLTFRRLCDSAERGADDGPLIALFSDASNITPWLDQWRARLAKEATSAPDRAAAMRRVNPVYIPRNHRVEEAIRAAETSGDFAPFERLVEVLARPFDEQPGAERYAEPPRPEEIVRQTFCGT